MRTLGIASFTLRPECGASFISGEDRGRRDEGGEAKSDDGEDAENLLEHASGVFGLVSG